MSLQGARVRTAHGDKFKTLSQPISNIDNNGPNHYFALKCSNLKWHHDSGAAEKFCSFENSPASPAFKKRGKDLNRRIAKRQNRFSFQHQFGLCLRAAKCERIVKVGESDGAFLVMRPLTLPHTNSRHLRTNYNTLLIFIIGEYLIVVFWGSFRDGDGGFGGGNGGAPLSVCQGRAGRWYAQCQRGLLH